MPIFEDKPRTYLGPANHAESHFNYLNRSGRPEIQARRVVLESWLSRVEDDKKRTELVRDIRSLKAAQHLSGVTELYLHELFLKLGFEIECHPSIAGTNRMPDYLLLRDGQPFCIVECAVALPTESKTDEQSVLQELYDRLNSFKDIPFWFALRYKGAPERNLSTKEVARDIEKWCRALPSTSAQSPTRVSNSFHYEGVTFIIDALPKSESARSNADSRNLGVYGGPGGSFDGRERVLRTLKLKSGRYGDLRIPYIIAVNARQDFTEDYFFTAALWGHETISFAIGEDGNREMEPGRAPNGFWNQAGRPSNTRVSGVMFLQDLNAFRFPITEPTLYLHLDPRYPLDGSFWLFDLWKQDDTGTYRKHPANRHVSELLQIDHLRT